MFRLKIYLQTVYDYLRDQKSQSSKPIRFYNWIGEIGSFWFEKFIHSRKIPCTQSKTIAFFSVFGEKFPIWMNKSRVKVFFTGENLNRNEFGFSFQNYSDCLQNKYFDLSLGFDYLESDKYLRFPLWILYFVDPNDTSDLAIKELCKRLSNHTPQDIHGKKSAFCGIYSR
jgi:hypothetical protein